MMHSSSFVPWAFVSAPLPPHVKDKHTDPAVICVDSMGRNAISVLSGHIGQANKITQDVAHILGANPVISTLSDNSGLWALDTLGQEFGWEVFGRYVARIL